METHLFCVQNADFYTMPLKADLIAKSERMFLELLVEIEPTDRCTWLLPSQKQLPHTKRTFARWRKVSL